MSALYDFLPVPPKGNNESGSHLYPKLCPYKTVSFDELTEKIASHSGLTKGNILAVMEEIENWTKQLLSEGYRVQIGNIGTVSASLKADAEVYDKGDIHAQSIRFDKVKVTVSKQFSKQCSGKVLRAPSGKKFQQSSCTYTEEERLALLQSYLESHDYITRAEYGALTGLLKYKAWQDLDKWVKAHLIDIKGRAPHRVYVKRKD
jgi:predicted histone-like DNA-binding protein